MRRDPGEQVLFSGHPSWRAMPGFHLKGVAFAVLAGVIVGLATSSGGGHVRAGLVAAAVVAVFALMLLRGSVRRAATTYTVTDRRLVIEQGILGRARHEAALEHVQDLTVRQSLGERMLGVGSLWFDTAGGAGFDFAFHGVERPRELVQAIDATLRRREYAGAPGGL